MSTVIQIATEDDIEKIAKDKIAVIHFYADWSDECKQMNTVFDELSKHKNFENVILARCVAEDLPKLSLKYQISAVPTFIFLKNLKQVDKVDGADPAALDKKLTDLVSSSSNGLAKPQPAESLDERLKKLINSHKVMIFMKGDRNSPRCGFSKQLIEMINETKLPYGTFDILEDEEVRQGLKIYSNWPTYPQLYVSGTLVGGLDIVKELKLANQLEETLQTDV